MDSHDAPVEGTAPANDAGAAAPQALFNPFGTIGVLAPAQPAVTAEPSADVVPSLLALVALAAGIALLLRKSLQ